MALRCLLFSSDEGTAGPIRQVLAGLGVEGEHCSEAVPAVEKVTNQSFQIVIIDWDNQPEAGILLTSARDRKASERPITLAIVSNDSSVPQALQAGANSILRKPILANQAKDTLTTARDLLRAKQESAQAAAATAEHASAPVPAVPPPTGEKMLRAGEFLQSAGPTPSAHFDTEPELHDEQSEPVDALKELEPMAASVAEEQPAPPPPPPPGESRGLAWYLNARGVTRPAAPPQAQSAPPPSPGKPELLGFDQTPSVSAPVVPAPARKDPATTSERHAAAQDHKTEAALFAYMSGESNATEHEAKPRFRLGKGAIIGALVLASVAVAAAPQAPWHANVKVLWARGQKMTHAWLNPQPVTTTPAPRSHEDFGRAGDEYKLPVAENIPDATTDPSQIRVTPIVDPTANKKLNNGAGNTDQNAADAAVTNPTDATQPSAIQVQENQPPQLSATAAAPATAPVPPSDSTTAPSPAAAQSQPHNDPLPVAAMPAPAPPRNPQPRYVSAPGTPGIPSSLKSQMASMTPDAGGNKPVDAALPSIEPVTVPEATERGLLADQPPIAYPANAKSQGTVVLQLLIGRDGTVQDAKFMQGSLAFARAAIDGVKQWKFKPYTMNGRPVSVQTQMTMTFKPGPPQ